MKYPELSIDIFRQGLEIFQKTDSDKLFLFVNNNDEKIFWLNSKLCSEDVVIIAPGKIDDSEINSEKKNSVLNVWSGNQSRFSRVKYAVLKGCHTGIISESSRITCVLGPGGRSGLDTIIVHDLETSWSEDFPFDPGSLTGRPDLSVIMAVLDIALDIGALGREGKSVGTIFIIGDSDTVLSQSHQAVFNPFEGYPPSDCSITRQEVVESIKELAKIDGAFVITGSGIVKSGGRHLESQSQDKVQEKGMGSRHRSASAMTVSTGAVAVVVSESTGRVTVFEKGRLLATLEPVISRRLE
ncbi:MAG: diadenylate cyclase [Spirochaetes bacterium]|nr:diadenylate cyclase [Spirochaetota bacterium]